MQGIEGVLGTLRSQALSAPESGIVELVNAGREQENLIPLWVGEGELPTPDFICEAAYKSLRDGETFYTYQRGLPELREALANYHESVYGRPFSSDRFFVTGSGMHAILIALQATVSAGEEILVPSPVWPNLSACAGIAGAHPVFVPMQFSEGRWELDMELLQASVTAKTKALFINSPCNPTGWVATRETLAELREFALKNNLWIIADEVYGRFVFGEEKRAPSFYDVAQDDDPILYVNTFSKNWAMTGWRIGWLSCPKGMGQIVENLVQYSTSGTAAFMQRAAVAALQNGDEFLQFQVEKAQRGRALLTERFVKHSRLNLSMPDGAFYLFFSIDGLADSRETAFAILRETGVGLAPGTAFGPGGKPFFRLCFARDIGQLNDASRLLCRWIGD
ncbi:pyridoxal phosphate-dependent aminotransferase [Pseudovibrio sp. SPO723]|uniref:pyridoxal phosphate-dependent aminotransferase n=1 Tax=Nesiotobacter zosterae TaxID=392721 RepID=UPI0029C47B4C|nr:pyridoxal phosphate-dependent aminotransferase [Pseudovibrio sp. SPO723]MDX5593205.1 pyridoxal phosphate-dependent aminotransferase [Pseudovibrio sp. SPO723]